MLVRSGNEVTCACPSDDSLWCFRLRCDPPFDPDKVCKDDEECSCACHFDGAVEDEQETDDQ